MIYSCIIAFSMYSKIPMPKVAWTKENMKYIMCFFPLVGIIIGVIYYFWGMIGQTINIGKILYATILLLIPIIITGGIHMDGLLDTADALSSYQSKERRLEILKDSHAGAFAIIICCVYFILYFGFLSEMSEKILPIVSLSFCLSRILSGLSVACFPCAKNSGLIKTFSSSVHKKITVVVLLMQLTILSAIFIYINKIYGITTIITSLLVFIYYHKISNKNFGGITGDLAGYFLQICELMILIALVVVEKVLGG